MWNWILQRASTTVHGETVNFYHCAIKCICIWLSLVEKAPAVQRIAIFGTSNVLSSPSISLSLSLPAFSSLILRSPAMRYSSLNNNSRWTTMNSNVCVYGRSKRVRWETMLKKPSVQWLMSRQDRDERSKIGRTYGKKEKENQFRRIGQRWRMTSIRTITTCTYMNMNHSASFCIYKMNHVTNWKNMNYRIGYVCRTCVLVPMPRRARVHVCVCAYDFSHIIIQHLVGSAQSASFTRNQIVYRDDGLWMRHHIHLCTTPPPPHEQLTTLKFISAACKSNNSNYVYLSIYRARM